MDQVNLRTRLQELELPPPDQGETPATLFTDLCLTVAILVAEVPLQHRERGYEQREQLNRAKRFWGFTDEWIEYWLRQYNCLQAQGRGNELLAWLRAGAPQAVPLPELSTEVRQAS